MFNFLEKPVHRRCADAGRVSCPARAIDIEIDACLACPRLVDIEYDGEDVVVRCQSTALLEYE